MSRHHTIQHRSTTTTVLVDPAGTLGESLCNALSQRQTKLVLVSSSPAMGEFAQRLAVNGVTASWRFLAPNLAGAHAGLRDDLASVFGGLDCLISFFPASPDRAEPDYLAQSSDRVSRLIQPWLQERLQLLRCLTPLLQRSRGLAINLHVGLHGRPDHSRGLGGHVAHLIDGMVGGQWNEWGIRSTHIATTNGSLLEAQRDLNQILSLLDDGRSSD